MCTVSDGRFPHRFTAGSGTPRQFASFNLERCYRERVFTVNNVVQVLSRTAPLPVPAGSQPSSWNSGGELLLPHIPPIPSDSVRRLARLRRTTRRFSEVVDQEIPFQSPAAQTLARPEDMFSATTSGSSFPAAMGTSGTQSSKSTGAPSN